MPSRPGPGPLAVLVAVACLLAPLAGQKETPKKPKGGTPTPASATRSATSLSDLVAIAAAKRLSLGMLVLDDAGRRIFAHQPEESFVPASNQKLLTAIAALEGLGAEYRFQTRFFLREGWLEVEPGGDPCWATGSPFDPAKRFANVGAELRRRGVVALRGVRVLDGGFVGADRPASWPQDQLDRLYCPPTGGLVFDEGTFRARVTPGTDAATVEVLAPPLVLPIEGAIRVGQPAKGRRAGFSLVEAGGKLLARGLVLPGSKPQEVSGLVQDPARIVEAALVQALARAGIEIRAEASVPDVELSAEQTPLVEALRPMLKESSNFHAEQMLRVLGKELAGEGSFAAGVRGARAGLEKALGSLPEGLTIVDGSGLSRDNRVTPALLARLLHFALGRPYAGALRDALPIGGVDGTLDQRFRDRKLAGRVFAKTGYIKGVSTLSGYVLDDEGRVKVFAILVNWDPDGKSLVQDAKELQEKAVECIAKRRAS